MRNQVPLRAGTCSGDGCHKPPQQQCRQQLLVIFLAPALGDAVSPLHAAAAGDGGGVEDDDGSSVGEDNACAVWNFRPLLQNIVQMTGDGRHGGDCSSDGENVTEMVSLHIMKTESDEESACPAFTAWIAELQLLQQQSPHLRPQLHIHNCWCQSFCSIPAQLSCAHALFAKNGSGVGTAVALLPFGFYRFFLQSPFFDDRIMSLVYRN